MIKLRGYTYRKLHKYFTNPKLPIEIRFPVVLFNRLVQSIPRFIGHGIQALFAGDDIGGGQEIARLDHTDFNLKRDHLEAKNVRKSLQCKFGDAVSTQERIRNTAQNGGDVHYAPLALADEWQECFCHTDCAKQVYRGDLWVTQFR